MPNAANWQGQMLTLLEDLLTAQDETTIAIESIPTGGSTAASSSWKLGQCDGCENWNELTPTNGECRRFPPEEESHGPTGIATSTPPQTANTFSCSEWRAVVGP